MTEEAKLQLKEKIDNFFSDNNLDTLIKKSEETLKHLQHYHNQIKEINLDVQKLTEIGNQKCKKCQEKLIEEYFFKRSRTPEIHCHQHKAQKPTTVRCITPTPVNPGPKHKTGATKKPKITNLKPKSKIQSTSPDLSSKSNRATSRMSNKSPTPLNKSNIGTIKNRSNLSPTPLKKNNIMISSKNRIAKSPTPLKNSHLRINTSNSKDKVVSNKLRKTEVTMRKNRELTPTPTLRTKKQIVKPKKIDPNIVAKKVKSRNLTPLRKSETERQKKYIKESIEQLKESVKLVNDSIELAEQKTKVNKKRELTPKFIKDNKKEGGPKKTKKDSKEPSKPINTNIVKKVNRIQKNNNLKKEEKSSKNNNEERLTKIEEEGGANAIEFEEDKYKKAFCLALRSGFFSIDFKISLVFNTPFLYHQFTKKSLIEEKIKYIKVILKKINNFISAHDPSIFNKDFQFSSSAISGMNLIKKEDEIALCKKTQPKEIINLFTIIYIILNENYFKIPTQSIILNLEKTILKKYEVASIKDLILKIIPQKTELSNDQIKLITQFKEDFPRLFSVSDLNKLSKVGAYISFCLSEFYDYVNAQFSDGVTLFQVKSAMSDRKLLEEKIEFLEKYLAN